MTLLVPAHQMNEKWFILKIIVCILWICSNFASLTKYTSNTACSYNNMIILHSFRQQHCCCDVQHRPIHMGFPITKHSAIIFNTGLDELLPWKGASPLNPHGICPWLKFVWGTLLPTTTSAATWRYWPGWSGPEGQPLSLEVQPAGAPNTAQHSCLRMNDMAST